MGHQTLRIPEPTSQLLANRQRHFRVAANFLMAHCLHIGAIALAPQWSRRRVKLATDEARAALKLRKTQDGFAQIRKEAKQPAPKRG